MIMQYFVTKWVEVISNVLLEGDYGQLNRGTASRFRFNPVEMPKINVWIGVWPKSLQSNKCKNDTILSNYSISFKINNFENPQALKGPWVKSHKLIIQKLKGLWRKSRAIWENLEARIYLKNNFSTLKPATLLIQIHFFLSNRHLRIIDRWSVPHSKSSFDSLRSILEALLAINFRSSKIMPNND